MFNFIIIYNIIAANSWDECPIKILKVFDKTTLVILLIIVIKKNIYNCSPLAQTPTKRERIFAKRRPNLNRIISIPMYTFLEFSYLLYNPHYNKECRNLT